MELSQRLKAAAREVGADLVGIADLAHFKDKGWVVIPRDLLGPYTSAVSVAVQLDDAIIDVIKDVPTPDYAQHYREVNTRLDGITARVVAWVEGHGFKATAIPASYVADEGNLLGAISHKAIARMAGIGWQGKSLLIVSPQYGPRIRLATVIADMPLVADKPMRNRCGTCNECSKACPVAAIKNVPTDSRYESREEALNLERCAKRTLEVKEMPGIGVRACGVCVRACPFGRRKK
jgi:epoxyqueuosine reductase QueG